MKFYRLQLSCISAISLSFTAVLKPVSSWRKDVKELNQKFEEFVQSISNTIPHLPLKPCSVCASSENLKAYVNYLYEDTVEYFAFIVCINCGYQSNGGGIFSDYHAAVCSAQEFWNSEQTDKQDEQKNPNKSE